MPQLPISPSVSPLPSGGASQSSATASALGDDGGGSADGSQGISFSSVLSKQLKDSAPQLEKSLDVAILAAAKDSVESAAGIEGAVTLPMDISALTASMLSPASLVAIPTAPVTSTRPGTELLVDAGVEKPLPQLLKGGTARLAAEVAAGGKNSPQAASPEQLFADKLAALVEVPTHKASGEVSSAELSVGANSSSPQLVLRNAETLTTLPVSPKVGSAAWGGAVGERVVWMANQSHQIAELHLNPPNLGPLEIRLTVNNDQATAMFVTQHSAVREAIETALPRLREMLADNGILLGNVTVGSESFSQQQTSDQWNGNGNGNARGMIAEEGVAQPVFVQVRPAANMRIGMVDIFA